MRGAGQDTARRAPKKILDACCAYRGIWFDKTDSRAVFQDIRSDDIEIKPNAAYPNGTVLKIRPDVVGDFTNMNFDDNSFHLVVFDPPHMFRKNPAYLLSRQYGVLPENWRDVIQKGFSECFRVLKPNGILVFKWNEYNIKVGDILKLTNEMPLFGHKSGAKSKTHWICFMKQESPVLGEESPAQNTMEICHTAPNSKSAT